MDKDADLPSADTACSFGRSDQSVFAEYGKELGFHGNYLSVKNQVAAMQLQITGSKTPQMMTDAQRIASDHLAIAAMVSSDSSSS